MDEKEFDWIVVGGGIAGISISEMLSRNGKSVLVLDKNKTLASETTKEFHEWWHTGVLFSLVPDYFSTTRYLLGALDDLLEYYSGFTGMNIIKQECGLNIKDEKWFNNDPIIYNYHNRFSNPLWMYSVAKSMSLSEAISSHDWLRRHGGGDEITGRLRTILILKKMLHCYNKRDGSLSITSSDFTINSRKLLGDLLSAAVSNGTRISCANAFKDIKEFDGHVEVITENEKYKSKNVVFCSPDLISQLFGANIKYGYAPMGVYEGVYESQKSFVNLDFNPRNCINLLRKKDGFGLAGGITVNRRSDIKDYFNYVHSEHIKLNPNMKLIDTYVGVKKELVSTGMKRNYQYHINQNTKKQWSVVLGKFSLFASLSVEFYRRAYSVNPILSPAFTTNSVDQSFLSQTNWAEITNIKEI